MKRVTVYLDENLHKSLKFKAAETSRTVSDLINEAVRDSLARNPAPKIQQPTHETSPATVEPEAAREPSLGFESVLDQMKRDGRIFD